MSYVSLLELNKTTLHNKIAQVQNIKSNLYAANDLIDVLSTQKERDKRMINDYSEDEVTLRIVRRDGLLRKIRFFTLAGIARYLTEGKIYAYRDACAYFNTTPIDLEEKSIADELLAMKTSTGTYKTTQLLKWLFGKRKMCKALGEYVTLSDVYQMFKDSPDIPDNKLKLLRDA